MGIISTTKTNYTTVSIAVSNETITSSTSFAEELSKSESSQNTVEESVVQQVKTNAEIIAEYRAKPGGDGFAYEGMFEEIIAASTAKHEVEFQDTYEFYDKYKDVFTPKYSNYTREKADGIARELNAEFPEYKAVKDKAYYGGTPEDMQKFNDMLMDYQTFNKYLHEKYDLHMGPGLSYTTEGARAYNFAIYDKLESGASISEATEYAGAVASSFGGNEAMNFQMMGFMGYPDSMEEAMKTPDSEKAIDYTTQIDLRDKGINHNFSYTNYDQLFGTDKTGIKQRIMYQLDLFSFLSKNEDLVDQKVAELKERSPQWFEFANSDGNYAKNLKESFKNSYEVAQFAQTIFEKYGDKIFNNNDVKSSLSTQELVTNKQEFQKNNSENTQGELEKLLKKSA